MSEKSDLVTAIRAYAYHASFLAGTWQALMAEHARIGTGKGVRDRDAVVEQLRPEYGDDAEAVLWLAGQAPTPNAC